MPKKKPKPSKFDRFEAFTKKLVQVPKKEIDEQAEKPLKRRPKRT